LQIAIDDPKAYSKPWNVAAKVHLLPQDGLIEYVCEENNKAPGHMVGKQTGSAMIGASVCNKVASEFRR
jgi:hypothetical protein